MFKGELCKLFKNKGVVFLLTFAVLVNIFQLFYLQRKNLQESDAYRYHGIWTELEEKYAAYGETAARNWIMSEGREASEEDRAEYAEVLSEFNEILGYKEYLQGILEYADKMQNVSIFAQKDSFSYRNIIKMRAEYARMTDIETSPAASLGVECATISAITDLIAVIVIMYICVYLWLKEKEDNIIKLLRTTPKGRKNLVWCKMAVLLSVVSALDVILNGSNILLGKFMYGLGDMGRQLVSVIAYKASIWQITVGEYILLFFLYKFVAYMVAALLISAICCATRSTLSAYILIIATASASILCYSKISVTSMFQPLKYLNPYGLMRTEEYFADYINLNIFGNPVKLNTCVIFFAAVLIFASGFTVIKTFLNLRKSIKTSILISFIRKKYIRLTNRAVRHTDMFCHELQKILFTQGAFWVITILLCIQVANYLSPAERPLTKELYYYKYYMLELEGEITAEKEAFLENEKLRYYDNNDAQKGILRVEEKIQYLKTCGGYILYEGGWDEMTAGNGYYTDLKSAVVVALELILALTGIFSMDKQYGMYNLVTTTKKGRRKLQVCRIMIGLLIVTIIVFCNYYFEYKKLWENNGLTVNMLSYPACSLSHLTGFDSSVSLGDYMLWLVGIRMLAAVTESCVIYYFSGKIGSLSKTVVIMFIIFAMPTMMMILKRNLLDWYYMWSAFSGNLALRYPEDRLRTLIVILMSVMIFCIYGTCKKKYIRCR